MDGCEKKWYRGENLDDQDRRMKIEYYKCG
jgi:hypothetical protein